MFEVTAAFPRSNADVCATDRCVVDDTLVQTGPLGNQTSLQIVSIESKRKIGKDNITP